MITLKAARVNAGLTQKEAAARIGITEKTLIAYEKGLKFPNVPKIKRIEETYGVGYNELIFLPENYD